MGKKNEDRDSSVYGYLNELVGDLCIMVGKALKHADEDAVHDARVTTRRLTAAIRLLDPVVSAEYRKPFAKALKSMRRRLGPLRDLDVMVGHLKEFQSQGRQTAAAQWLKDQLEHERAELREDASAESSIKALHKLGSWLALGEEVRSAEDQLPALLAEAIQEQTTTFGQEADRLAANPKSHGHDSQTNPPAQDPHELRISGKQLRYSLELAAIAGVALPARCLKQFKRLQESLGLWHDYVVLCDKALRCAVDCGVAVHRPAVYEQIMDFARLIWRQAQRHLGQFASLWLKHGEALLTMIREALPSPHVPEEQSGVASEPESAPQIMEAAEPTAITG